MQKKRKYFIESTTGYTWTLCFTGFRLLTFYESCQDLKCLQEVFLVFEISWRFDHSHRTNRNEYGWILTHIRGLWVQGDSVYRVNLLLPVDGR